MTRGRSDSPGKGGGAQGKERSPSPAKRLPGVLGGGLGDNIGFGKSPAFGKETNFKYDKVKKNANGGVLITPEEIKIAYDLLNSEQIGVSQSVLKKRLGVLFPDLVPKDYRFLMNNKKDVTLDDLNELLLENEITNFDPVAEAFKVFDIKNEGTIDGEKLRQTFLAYGFGELNDEEYEILIRAADVDGDGAISLDDFRNMLDSVNRNSVKQSKKPT